MGTTKEENWIQPIIKLIMERETMPCIFLLNKKPNCSLEIISQRRFS